jgi:hypothetical protein
MTITLDDVADGVIETDNPVSTYDPLVVVESVVLVP